MKPITHLADQAPDVPIQRIITRAVPLMGKVWRRAVILMCIKHLPVTTENAINLGQVQGTCIMQDGEQEHDFENGRAPCATTILAEVRFCTMSKRCTHPGFSFAM